MVLFALLFFYLEVLEFAIPGVFGPQLMDYRHLVEGIGRDPELSNICSYLSRPFPNVLPSFPLLSRPKFFHLSKFTIHPRLLIQMRFGNCDQHHIFSLTSIFLISWAINFVIFLVMIVIFLCIMKSLLNSCLQSHLSYKSSSDWSEWSPCWIW